MIGSITKGRDFGGCVRYALAVDEPGKEARLLYAEGVLSDTPRILSTVLSVSDTLTNVFNIG